MWRIGLTKELREELTSRLSRMTLRMASEVMNFQGKDKVILARLPLSGGTLNLVRYEFLESSMEVVFTVESLPTLLTRASAADGLTMQPRIMSPFPQGSSRRKVPAGRTAEGTANTALRPDWARPQATIVASCGEIPRRAVKSILAGQISSSPVLGRASGSTQVLGISSSVFIWTLIRAAVVHPKRGTQSEAFALLACGFPPRASE